MQTAAPRPQAPQTAAAAATAWDTNTRVVSPSWNQLKHMAA